MISFSPNPSNVSSELASLGARDDSVNLNLESGDVKDADFTKRVDEWEKDAPTGEDRREGAIDIKDAYARGVKIFFIERSSISNLPPLPRTITDLNIIACNNLEQLNGDLSHLSELSILGCCIKTWPDNLTNLTSLSLCDCNGPGRLLVTSSQLTSLDLSICTGITELSGELPLLQTAFIADCPSLTTWSCSVPKLVLLSVRRSPKLRDFPDDLPANLKTKDIPDIPDNVLYSSQIKRDQKKMQEILSQFLPEQIGEVRQNLIDTNEAQSYKQKYPRSCAGASLFFIARELDFRKNPLVAETLKKFPLLSKTYPRYRENLPLQFITEEDVYKISSEFEGDIANIGRARGSWPHNIILAAKGLGLEAELYLENNNYDPIMLAAKEKLLDNGITANEKKPQLSNDELEMKLLSYVDSSGNRISGAWDEIFHWVVLRPDGSFMDPGSGQNFNSVLDLNNAYAAIGRFAVDAGMSIVLRDTAVESDSSCTIL